MAPTTRSILFLKFKYAKFTQYINHLTFLRLSARRFQQKTMWKNASNLNETHAKSPEITITHPIVFSHPIVF